MSAEIEPLAAGTTLHPRLSLWAMGLANSPTGFVFGFVSTTSGILLAARHVPVARVGEIVTIAFSPCFWGWLMAPVLDIRFTRRAYAYFFATLAALLLACAMLTVDRLGLFTALLTASVTAAVLYATAVGSMIPDIVSETGLETVSAWFNVAYLGAAGVFSLMAIVLLRNLRLQTAAVLLALLVAAPALLLLPRFPPSPRPRGTPRANFAAMLADLRRVLREGRIWVGLLIFLVPVGGFALTNLFSTIGGEFAASERVVTVLTGPMVALACSAGCLLAVPLCRRWPRRMVYLGAGAAAALVAVAMGVLPRTVAVYAIGLLAYNALQGFNYTAMLALEFDIVGPRNALAGSMMALLTASTNVPISAMTWVDSRMHDAHGTAAMFYTDGGVAIVTIALLVVALPLLDRVLARRAVPAATIAEA